MGATTRIHPVGLYVIRGGLQYCGFSLGKLKQKAVSSSGYQASYEAEIVLLPPHLESQTDFTIIMGFMNDCFAKDIEVTEVWKTRQGRLKCLIDTQIPAHHETIGAAEAGWSS